MVIGSVVLSVCSDSLKTIHQIWLIFSHKVGSTFLLRLPQKWFNSESKSSLRNSFSYISQIFHTYCTQACIQNIRKVCSRVIKSKQIKWGENRSQGNGHTDSLLLNFKQLNQSSVARCILCF